jgi:hypothetical protein
VKQIKPLLFASLFLLPALAGAETFYSPRVCQGERTLVLSNKSNTDEAVWLQFIGDRGHDSDLWELKPRQTKTLPDHALPGDEFVLRTSSSAVTAHTECDGKVIPWLTKTSALRRWKVPVGTHLKFFVQNLNPREQTVMLRFRNSQGQVTESRQVNLEMYMTTSVFKAVASGTYVELEGDGRISVLVWSADNFLNERPVEPLNVDVEDGHYFMMARPDFSESFVVRIDDPALAQTARELIGKGSMKLLFADVEYTARSENRSLTDRESSPYSWRVGKVYGFNDFGSIFCDGSPEIVQENIFKWLMTKRICFWGFKLKKELTPEEVRRGRLSP